MTSTFIFFVLIVVAMSQRRPCSGSNEHVLGDYCYLLSTGSGTQSDPNQAPYNIKQVQCGDYYRTQHNINKAFVKPFLCSLHSEDATDLVDTKIASQAAVWIGLTKDEEKFDYFYKNWDDGTRFDEREYSNTFLNSRFSLALTTEEQREEMCFAQYQKSTKWSDENCDTKFLAACCQYKIPTCQGVLGSSENACNGGGYCLQDDVCTCIGEGVTTRGDFCEVKKCFDIWGDTSQVCSGNGKCAMVDVCECSTDYFGKMCKEKVEPIYVSGSEEIATTKKLEFVYVSDLSVLENPNQTIVPYDQQFIGNEYQRYYLCSDLFDAESFAKLGDSPKCIITHGALKTSTLTIELGENYNIVIGETLKFRIFDPTDGNLEYAEILVTLPPPDYSWLVPIIVVPSIIGVCVVIVCVVLIILIVIVILLQKDKISYNIKRLSRRKQLKHLTGRTDFNAEAELKTVKQSPKSKSVQQQNITKTDDVKISMEPKVPDNIIEEEEYDGFVDVPLFTIDVKRELYKNSTYSSVLEATWNDDTVLFREINPQFIGDRKMDKVREKYEQQFIKFSTFDHPNIYKILGQSKKKRRIFVVSEFAKKSLREYMKKMKKKGGQIPFTKKIEILKDVANGFKYLNEKNFQVDPYMLSDEIIVTEDGFKLDCMFDFGFNLKNSRYVAPERIDQSIGKDDSDDSDDSDDEDENNLPHCVFAYGILMYDLMAEKFPMEEDGIAEEFAADEANRPSVDDCEAKFEGWYQNLMTRCIAENPKRRPDFEKITQILDSVALGGVY